MLVAVETSVGISLAGAGIEEDVEDSVAAGVRAGTDEEPPPPPVEPEFLRRRGPWDHF